MDLNKYPSSFFEFIGVFVHYILERYDGKVYVVTKALPVPRKSGLVIS